MRRTRGCGSRATDLSRACVFVNRALSNFGIAARNLTDAYENLRAHLKRLAPGDYFALLAYLERNTTHDRLLQTIRRKIRDSHGVATCIGFGPRFLYSTGQAYKGGLNSGVFPQLTCDHVEDLPVPGHRFTFGVVMAAQARSDSRVLTQRGLRALHVHLGADIRRGLDLLNEAIEPVLA